MFESGDRLGPYEILATLGAGGMGEVYRARDSRLARDVAVKVLPAAFSTDPERLRRFELEARAAAALNHPNILAVYDVGAHNGAPYIVSELLEGETLRARMAKTPGRGIGTPGRHSFEGLAATDASTGLPLRRAVDYAVQMIHGLAAAHDRGIVHRDLKPENVFLTTDGRIKILDFGLAKLIETALSNDDLSETVALSSSDTSHGAVLGTLGYMAPEQVRGQTVDGRADVFAFGAILYEMLSGRRAFSGATAADVVTAILDKDRLPLADREIPSSLARIVDRCLEKSADARFQSTRDLAFALETLDTSSSAGAAPASVPTQSARARAWKLLAGTTALAAIGLAWPATLYLRRGATEPVVTRLDVVTPPSLDPYALALSPDGRQLVFAVASGGRSQLGVRSFAETAARPLAGTEGGRFPFWSPDGRAIGFFADAKLKVIDLAGGMPRVLADAPGGAGGTWNRDGVILFAPFGLGGLMRAAAGGGSVAPVTKLSAAQGSHRFPSFLPDGRRFLFVSVLGRPETDGLFVGSLDSSPPTRLLDTGAKAAYASPGYLLLVAQGTLVAYPFDAARGIVSGERMPVAQPVGNDGPHGAFAVSETGVLAYRNVDERRQLVWADRAGKVLPALPPDEAYQLFPEIGPRGLIAVNRVVQGNFDVWLIDLARGGASRFTAHPAFDNDAVWSPDGIRLAFASSRNGHSDLFVKPTDAATDEQLLLASEQDKAPQDWSPDGRVLLYASQDPKTSSDLWALPLDPSPAGPISSRSQKPFAIAQTTFDEIQGKFSPDGRWVAYASNEAERYEVYIRPFPGPGGRQQVSVSGGISPRWRRDGHELFYVAADGRMMAVPVNLPRQGAAIPGVPAALFATRFPSGGASTGFGSRAQYDVTPDGRFLMIVNADGSTPPPITVVLNWTAGLKK